MLIIVPGTYTKVSICFSITKKPNFTHYFHKFID